MSRYRRGVFYVRRMRPTDQADTWQTAIRLGFFQMTRLDKGKAAYVLVRHGFPDVLEVDKSKRVMQSRLCSGRAGRKSFKQNCRRWRVK